MAKVVNLNIDDVYFNKQLLMVLILFTTLKMYLV